MKRIRSLFAIVLAASLLMCVCTVSAEENAYDRYSEAAANKESNKVTPDVELGEVTSDITEKDEVSGIDPEEVQQSTTSKENHKLQESDIV